MTTVIRGTDNSVSAPAVSGSDGDTGLYFPAANQVALATNGTQAVFVDSSQNVGIGTSSPGSKLTLDGTFQIGVAGSAADVGITKIATRNIRFDSAPTTGTGITVNVGTDANQNSTFIVNGNVGIGTTSPSYELDIQSSSGDCELAITGSTTNNAVLKLENVTSGTLADIYADNSKNLIFRTDGTTERARITSGGDFYINTTIALVSGRKLQVSGTSAFYQSGGSSTEVLDIWNNATTGNNLFTEFATEGTYTVRGTIDYNRTGGQVRYNTTSDATLKNVFGDSDGQRSLEILSTTRLREYAWKDDAQQNKQVGVIAQELHETYKGAVSVGGEYEVEIPAVTEQRLVSEAVLDEEGNEIEAAVYETVEIEPSRTETKYRPWAVKTAFTFHLIAGWQAHEKLLKEAMTRIEALEAEVAALKGAN